MEAAKPGAVRDLDVAHDYDRGLRPAMLERSGAARAPAVLAGIKDWVALKERQEELAQLGGINPWSRERALMPARQKLEAAFDRDPDVLALARTQAKAQESGSGSKMGRCLGKS